MDTSPLCSPIADASPCLERSFTPICSSVTIILPTPRLMGLPVEIRRLIFVQFFIGALAYNYGDERGKTALALLFTSRAIQNEMFDLFAETMISFMPESGWRFVSKHLARLTKHGIKNIHYRLFTDTPAHAQDWSQPSLHEDPQFHDFRNIFRLWDHPTYGNIFYIKNFTIDATFPFPSVIPPQQLTPHQAGLQNRWTKLSWREINNHLWMEAARLSMWGHTGHWESLRVVLPYKHFNNAVIRAGLEPFRSVANVGRFDCIRKQHTPGLTCWSQPFELYFDTLDRVTGVHDLAFTEALFDIWTLDGAVPDGASEPEVTYLCADRVKPYNGQVVETTFN